MNLDSNIMRDVGMEHGKLLGKGKKGHKLEAASFHLTDRVCVFGQENGSPNYPNRFRKTEINKEHGFKVI